MAEDIPGLFNQYYEHLRHTEKERNRFLQILIGISGGSILGAESILKTDPLKPFFYLILFLISSFSYLIMRKKGKVIRCYTSNILRLIGENDPFTECIRNTNDISMSSQYENIVIVISLFYLSLLSVNIIPYLNQLRLQLSFGLAIVILTHGYVYCMSN